MRSMTENGKRTFVSMNNLATNSKHKYGRPVVDAMSAILRRPSVLRSRRAWNASTSSSFILR
jgi:hypothetical protein